MTVDDIVKEACEGLNITKMGEDSFMTCPIPYYLGASNCLLNHPVASFDIQTKEQCPLYLMIENQTEKRYDS